MGFLNDWSIVKLIGVSFAVVFGLASVAVAIYVAVRRRDQFVSFLKAWGGLVALIAAAIGIYALVRTCLDMVAAGELIPQLFYPIGATIVWAVLGALVLVVLHYLAPNRVRVVGLVWALVVGAGVVASVVFIGIYYVDVIRDSGYYQDVSTLALALGAVLLVAILAVMAIFCGRKTERTEQTRSLVSAGVCVALSFALSYVTFFKMPQGGSITLASMLPLLVYSYRYGVRRGILAGLVYGLLQAVQDPWIIHPAQFLLDYPLAFAMLGLAGWLRGIAGDKVKGVASYVVGTLTAVILRYLAHVISGIFAFASYAAPGYGAVAWGFLYNTFCLVDGGICLVLGIILFANRGVRRLVYGDASVPLRLHRSHRTADGMEGEDVSATEGGEAQ